MGYIGTSEDVFSLLQVGISHTLCEADANIISGDHEDQGTEMLHVVSEITQLSKWLIKYSLLAQAFPHFSCH